jgi:hypothetical protein
MSSERPQRGVDEALRRGCAGADPHTSFEALRLASGIERAEHRGPRGEHARPASIKRRSASDALTPLRSAQFWTASMIVCGRRAVSGRSRRRRSASGCSASMRNSNEHLHTGSVRGTWCKNSAAPRVRKSDTDRDAVRSRVCKRNRPEPKGSYSLAKAIQARQYRPAGGYPAAYGRCCHAALAHRRVRCRGGRHGSKLRVGPNCRAPLSRARWSPSSSASARLRRLPIGPRLPRARLHGRPARKVQPERHPDRP